MLSNLLTALGVAALSIQTPSNIQPQEPKRAYYNSSAVADYGTTSAKIYNYTSSNLEIGYYIEEDNTLNAVSGYSFQLEPATNTNFGILAGVQIKDNNGNSVTDKFSISPYNATQKVDLYRNGEFLAVLEYKLGHGPNGYFFELGHSSVITATDYLWLFDHYEPNMSETIAEVVGDATTAAGAVLGSGISGAIALFYNEGITGLGIIALILTGVSLVWFAFSLVLRLWRRR